MIGTNWQRKLDEFKGLLREILVELKAIRKLLEQEQTSYIIEVDADAWHPEFEPMEFDPDSTAGKSRYA